MAAKFAEPSKPLSKEKSCAPHAAQAASATIRSSTTPLTAALSAKPRKSRNSPSATAARLSARCLQRSPLSARLVLSRRQHLNHAHHPAVFVLQDVAVIRKHANRLRAAEIHPQLHAWVCALPIPIRKIDGVSQAAFLHGLAIALQNLKMQLVNMEIVRFRRAILHHPIFHRALPRHNVR